MPLFSISGDVPPRICIFGEEVAAPRTARDMLPVDARFGGLSFGCDPAPRDEEPCGAAVSVYGMHSKPAKEENVGVWAWGASQFYP